MVRPQIGIDPHEAAALLTGLVAVSAQQMREAGPHRLMVQDAIQRGLFIYDRNDPDERWKTYADAIEEVRRNGAAHLDCEDLASLVVAELQVTGQDPRAFPYVYRARGHTFHVVAGSPRYGWLDPSVAAGM